MQDVSNNSLNILHGYNLLLRWGKVLLREYNARIVTREKKELATWQKRDY